jgi:hypothetical protein
MKVKPARSPVTMGVSLVSQRGWFLVTSEAEVEGDWCRRSRGCDFDPPHDTVASENCEECCDCDNDHH